MQQVSSGGKRLLTALEVQDLLHVDRSTVYRMAEDGRLPSIRVGRTWRFPAEQIIGLVDGSGIAPAAPDTPAAGGRANAGHPGQIGPDQRVAQTAIDVAADLLGVMMVVTDMNGHPITEVANPCPWFAENSTNPEVLDRCVAEWKALADAPDLTPSFSLGANGFECARTFVRYGTQLVGMVLAGGVSPGSDPRTDPDLYHLDGDARGRVLSALPRIAAAITTRANQAPSNHTEESP